MITDYEKPDTGSLLTKDEVSEFLHKARALLYKGEKTDDRALEIVFCIDNIVGEAECCIVNWTDVVVFYRRAYCMLARSIGLLGNGDRHAVQGQMAQLKAAEIAVKPLVLDHLRGKGDPITFIDLGY